MSEISNYFGNKLILIMIYNTILIPPLHPNNCYFHKTPKKLCLLESSPAGVIIQAFSRSVFFWIIKEKLSLQISAICSFHSFPVETLRHFYLLYLEVIRAIIKEWWLVEQALFQRNHSVSTNLLLIFALSFSCILISLTVIIEFLN